MRLAERRTAALQSQMKLIYLCGLTRAPRLDQRIAHDFRRAGFDPIEMTEVRAILVVQQSAISIPQIDLALFPHLVHR